MNKKKFIPVVIIMLAGVMIYFGPNIQGSSSLSKILSIPYYLFGQAVYKSGYFTPDAPASPPPSKIPDFLDCAYAGNRLELSDPMQCWTPEGEHFVEDINEERIPVPGPITVIVEDTCLPKKGPGAGTTECRDGIKEIGGRHYGLSHSFPYSSLLYDKSSVSGPRYKVSGIFHLKKIKAYGFDTYYDAIGVIDMTSISSVEDPEGTGLTLYPDLPLTSFPEEPVSTKFIFEHRSALDGQTISVRGIVMDTLRGLKIYANNTMTREPSIALIDEITKNNPQPIILRVLISTEERVEKEFPIGKIINVKITVEGNKDSVFARKIY